MTNQSVRDMFAASAAEGMIAGHRTQLDFTPKPFEVALYAFEVADAMMKWRDKEKRDHELEDLRRQVGKMTIKADILRGMLAPGQSAPAIALEELWEFLGVNNQTAAMTQLEQMKAFIAEASHD